MRLFACSFFLLWLLACATPEENPVQLPEASDPACPYMVPVTEVFLEPILFDKGIARWKRGSETALDAVLDVMDAHPEWSLTITGQTRTEGRYQDNRKLAEARVDMVEAYLHDKYPVRWRIVAIIHPESGEGLEAQSVAFQFCQPAEGSDGR